VVAFGQVEDGRVGPGASADRALWLAGSRDGTVLLRPDNGLVFTSRSYTALVRSSGLQQEFITPYCPQQNGMVECIIRTLKEQYAHRHRFETLQHTSLIISDWISFYNYLRLHQPISMKAPAQAFALTV